MPINYNEDLGGGVRAPSYLPAPTPAPVPTPAPQAPSTSPTQPWDHGASGSGFNFISSGAPIDQAGLIGATIGTGGGGGYIDPSGTTHTFPWGGGGVASTPGAPPPSGPQTTQSPFDSDPGYQAALAAQQLGIGSINNNLNSLVAQRIAAYGDPNLASQAGFGLDPQAAAFARQNYLSGNAELARIDKAHKDARQAIINRLAGHGLLDSGETGYQNGQEDQGYGNNVFDAQQRVLSDLLGYRTNALTSQSNLRQSVVDALQTAYGNYLNHPEFYGYGQQAANTVTAQPPAKTSTVAPKTATPKKTAVVTQLVNPYVTGQKKRG